MIPLVAVLSIVLAPARAAAPPDDQANTSPTKPPTLTETITRLLDADFLSSAKVGIRVVDLADDRVVFEHNQNLALNPASNIKLVTTAAALARLGPEHRYSTRAYGKKDSVDGEVLRGNLYLRGGGDPSLVTADLYELASDLRARGIRRITGRIVVDSTRFDRDELPPGFDQKDELASYRAPSGAASVNFNTYVVRVRPAESAGSGPAATIDPPVRGIEITNSATTVEGRRNRLEVQVTSKDETIEVHVRGQIGVEAGPASFRYPVSDPSRYAGEVFRLVLKQRGIRLGSSAVKARERPREVELLAVHYSPPMSVLARSVNKLSNNFMAEQILKTLDNGREPATFERGLAQVRDYLRAIGMSEQGLVLGNGSGLYDTNRISAAQLTHVLERAYRDFRYSSDYMASLAIMGVDGTTRSRNRETAAERYVRAKTGTLNGISALSGYAGTLGRAPLVFSILINDLERYDIGKARQVQNQIAEALALHAAGKPMAVLEAGDSGD